MTVLVVLSAVVLGIVAGFELRFVGLWLLVRLADAVEGADPRDHRHYGDFRRVMDERGVAGLDLAWRSEPDARGRAADRPDWQLHSGF
ncbi:hypothetical protein Acsp06_11330 [Actinomycetospora sp. NBRC 106375]|uniref:hypothetical protein n=1 Tax=Actinomycetospora sp. NBRC 106375 TaxID=3032207 RepID=UPI0024A506DA|nr:hypothetical protein [Actinomycetospora sp. NBRC 106375]GLZ44948.1 hypothetical protein Acsp06_11330 [Actinomycetospora sp. NBRC 106375]